MQKCCDQVKGYSGHSVGPSSSTHMRCRASISGYHGGTPVRPPPPLALPSPYPTPPEAGPDDLVADLHRVLGVKRRVAHQHFVHDHTHRPPIALRPVALLQQHFRCDIPRRPHRREELRGKKTAGFQGPQGPSSQSSHLHWAGHCLVTPPGGGWPAPAAPPPPPTSETLSSRKK